MFFVVIVCFSKMTLWFLFLVGFTLQSIIVIIEYCGLFCPNVMKGQLNMVYFRCDVLIL